MGPENAVRILVADSHSLFREAVKVALDGEPDLQVVAEAGDAIHALAEAERRHPDVAVVDEELPGGGTAVLRTLSERFPSTKGIILGAEEDLDFLIEALLAGASGYVSKLSPLDELVEATRAVSRGETPVPRRLIGALLSRLLVARTEKEQALRLVARLTGRERQVLALLAQRCDRRTIAESLMISPQTARTHIQNIFAKLAVHSQLEAAAFVTQNGILDELLPDELVGQYR
jgi:two-component system response regulator DevR